MKYQQPKKSDIEKWCDALRSGEYKQDVGAFQTDEGFCCLGVACKEFVKKPTMSNGVLLGIATFECHPNVPKWLTTINHDVSLKIGSELWVLNDKENLSFDEIADVLELIYIHKALD